MPLSGKEFIDEIQVMVRREHSKKRTQAFDESIGRQCKLVTCRRTKERKKRDESNTIALDGTPLPMAREFLQMLREKRDFTIAVSEQRAGIRSVRSLALH